MENHLTMGYVNRRCLQSINFYVK